MTLPNTVTLGVASKPLPQLRLGLDGQYTSWQQFQKQAFTFQNSSLDQTVPKNWSGAFGVHFGGQYSIDEAWAVRAGVSWDEATAPASTVGPDLPDSARTTVYAGVGYIWGPFHFDLAYLHIFFAGVTSTYPVLPGTYTGRLDAVSGSIGFHI
jgi:long-chain fatty acid transport protein